MGGSLALEPLILKEFNVISTRPRYAENEIKKNRVRIPRIWYNSSARYNIVIILLKLFKLIIAVRFYRRQRNGRGNNLLLKYYNSNINSLQSGEFFLKSKFFYFNLNNSSINNIDNNSLIYRRFVFKLNKKPGEIIFGFLAEFFILKNIIKFVRLNIAAESTNI